MNQDDKQFQALFESLRQRDQAATPQFESFLQRAEQRQATQPVARRRWPALAIAASILLLISLFLVVRSGEDDLADAQPPLNFDDTRLVVQRHFQNLNWSSPTEELLGTQPSVKLPDNDT